MAKLTVRHSWVLAMATTAAGIVAFPAAADDQPSASSDGAAGGLEVVTVTARKRVESLQAVPVTVSAVTGENLEQSGIKTMDQVSEKVPGLYFTSIGGGQAQPQIAMRGNSSRNAVVNDVSTGFFTDGVYTTAYNQLMHGPVDAQRVEVLAGPQGTVFGRNTIAGAINIITNDPTKTLEGKVGAGWGRGANFDENIWHADAMVSGPITDTLSGRLVYSHEQRDGYLLNQLDGDRLLGTRSDYARGKLLWQPSDSVDVRFTGEWAQDFRPRFDILTDVPGGHHPLSTLPQSAFFFPGKSDSNPFVVQTDTDLPSTSKMLRGYLQVDWRTAVGTVTSVTSYGLAEFVQNSDPDDSRYFLGTQYFDYATNTLSQELRLTGSSERFEWLGGLYYLNDNNDRNDQIIDFGPTSTLYAAGVAGQYVLLTQKTDSYAVFGQAGYHITDALRLTAGARWSRDSKRSPMTGYVVRPAGNIAGTFNIVRDESWSSPTGLVSISYDWLKDVMTYVSYSTGFKAGGFQATTSPVVSASPFSPEKVWQVEAGLKSMWLDRRLRANISGYALNYSDLQVNSSRFVNNQFISLIGNAAGAHVRGVDLDLQALVASSLTLGLSYTYMPTANIVGYSSIGSAASIDGFRIPRSPKNSATLSADYVMNVLTGKLTVGADYIYRGAFVNELDSTKNSNGTYATLPLPSYGLLNLRSAFETGPWTLAAYLRNATDKVYYPSANSLGGGSNSFYHRTIGLPRTWEISVERHF